MSYVMVLVILHLAWHFAKIGSIRQAKGDGG